MISLTSGIAVGSIYGLMGLSLCAIYNASRVVNFAQGEFAMLGAYAASLFIFSGNWPLPAGIAMLIALPVILGIALHFILVEPLLRVGAPIILIILSLLGGGLIAQGTVGVITDYSYFTTRLIFGIGSQRFWHLSVSNQQLAIIIATVILSIAYWFLLNKTRIGLSIRAVGVDAEVASTMGINLSRIRLLTWCISAFIGGIAGFLVAPLMMPSALVGLTLLINGFIAAVFGGFGEPFTALAGGIILGILASLFSAYVSPGNSQLFMFLAMLVVLAIRPGGLLMRGK